MRRRPTTAGSGGRRNRRQWMFLLIPAMFLTAFDLRAQAWWEKSPYTQWPGKRVYELLTDSPWAVQSPAGFRQGETRTFNNGVMSNYRGYPITCYYLVRMISAKPIREALLRAISLQGMMLNVRNAFKTGFTDFKSAQEQERLDSFLASRPNDLRVKGDQQQIIIGITLKVNDRTSSREEDYGKELSNIDVTHVTQETCLATNSGRCAELSYFKLAGPDRLGVKFYFSRTLPDGLPLVAPLDKELRFATRLNGTDIKVKFNLKKMLYRGKLEN